MYFRLNFKGQKMNIKTKKTYRSTVDIYKDTVKEELMDILSFSEKGELLLARTLNKNGLEERIAHTYENSKRIKTIVSNAFYESSQIYFYTYENDLLATYKDENSTICYTYDHQNRLLSQIETDNEGLVRYSIMGIYQDDKGVKIFEHFNDQEQKIREEGSRFDRNGNEVESWVKMLKEESSWFKGEYYEYQGPVIKPSSKWEDGNLLIERTFFEYDENDNLLFVKAFENDKQIFQINYSLDKNGQVVQKRTYTTDEMFITKYLYNNVGLLKQKEDYIKNTFITTEFFFYNYLHEVTKREVYHQWKGEERVLKEVYDIKIEYWNDPFAGHS